MNLYRRYMTNVIMLAGAIATILVGFIIAGSFIYDIIIDDGCQVEKVDILPDEDGMHHYLLHIDCDKSGRKKVDVWSNNDPPDAGPMPNPVRDYGIIFVFLGLIITFIGIILVAFSMYQIKICLGERPPMPKPNELENPMLALS